MEKYTYLRYQYRIYLNSTQRKQDAAPAGCCRFVYNYYLNFRSFAWNVQRRSMNYNSCANDLKYLKLVFTWLKDADSMALQETLKDLQKGFDSFFAGNAKYPQFKTKKQSGHSYRTRNQNNGIRLSADEKYIHLPKLDWVKIKLTRPVPGKIENATIIRKPSGKYFISLTVKIPTSELMGTNNGEEHGLDLGIKSLYTLEDGTKAENIKTLRKYERKLTRAQRRLSRMKKGSRNFIKQKRKVARLHEKITNIRHDHLHQESTKLARECSLLCIEDLNIKGMVRNHHLAQVISDASWGAFTKMLEYKMSLHGGTLVKVSRFFASTQTCHICGYKNPKAKDLSVREWTCPECGTLHDRDVNGAACLLAEGKRILSTA